MYDLRNYKCLFLFLLLFLFGCKHKANLPIQKCLMCGAEFSVQTLNKNEIVPPTIEWCFYDGSFCQDGLNLTIKCVKSEADPKVCQEFLEHCKTCIGCRCAAYTPEKWHAVEND